MSERILCVVKWSARNSGESQAQHSGGGTAAAEILGSNSAAMKPHATACSGRALFSRPPLLLPSSPLHTAAAQRNATRRGRTGALRAFVSSSAVSVGSRRKREEKRGGIARAHTGPLSAPGLANRYTHTVRPASAAMSSNNKSAAINKIKAQQQANKAG